MTSRDEVLGLTKHHPSKKSKPAHNKMIKIRLTEDEKEELCEAAAVDGVTLSEFVRMAIAAYSWGKLLRTNTKRAFSRELARAERDAALFEFASELKRLRIELTRQGTNLNQITRQINKHGNASTLNDELVERAERESRAAHVAVDAAIAQVDVWMNNYAYAFTETGGV